MKLYRRVAAALLLWLGTGLALAQQDEDLSQAELEQILAPIALYPDSVLSHVLIAATYPLEVVMAERWARNNPGLTGAEAVNAVEDRDWDPSVKALAAFPDILERMSEDLDWTERLGEAFLADEERVLDSVQKLRQQAYDAGTLKDLEHLSVSRDEERHIVIEPVVREVVYIPYYDSRVVYGSWWWADHPPVYWHHHHHHYDHVHWHWGPRIRLSSRFYFSAFHWSHRRVVVIHHHHYRGEVWRARQIVRHRHASHWRHDPYHRRGATYRNPRTRDYFQRQHRDSGRVVQQRRSFRSDEKHQQLRRDLSGGREVRQSAGSRDSRLRAQSSDARQRSPEVRQRSQLGSAKREASAASSQRSAPRPQAQSRVEKRSAAPRREHRAPSVDRSALKRDSAGARNRAINNRSSGSARTSRPTEGGRSSGLRQRRIPR